MWAVGRLSLLSRGRAAVSKAPSALPDSGTLPAVAQTLRLAADAGPKTNDVEKTAGVPELSGAALVTPRNVAPSIEPDSAGPGTYPTIADAPPAASFLHRLAHRVKRLFRAIFG